MMNAATIEMLIAMIDAGTLTGSKGENKLGDKVYHLGRLPREQGTKYLYIHPFAKPNAAGATHRAYVQYAP